LSISRKFLLSEAVILRKVSEEPKGFGNGDDVGSDKRHSVATPDVGANKAGEEKVSAGETKSDHPSPSLAKARSAASGESRAERGMSFVEVQRYKELKALGLEGSIARAKVLAERKTGGRV
jgi:hypothetical protein